MHTLHEAPRADLNLVRQRIQHLAEWARHANAYVDEHNAPPPDDIDDVTREELVVAMEELGDLMQRHADSLRRLADREPSSVCNAAQDDGKDTTRLGMLLQFPARSRPDPMPPRDGTDHRARPYA